MCLPALLTFLVAAAGPIVFVQGRWISCACNTLDCQAEGIGTCNTTGLCFSQWLDRRDGSDPLIRGCVSSRTPLLCENRRPSLPRHRDWPVLACCDTPLCNLHASPTNTPPPSPPLLFLTSSPPPQNIPPSSPESAPLSTDALYLVMVGVGVCCFGLVTCIALIFSRRTPSCCDPEAHGGYVKGCPLEPHSDPLSKVALQST